MASDQQIRLETLLETLHKRWGSSVLQTGQTFTPKTYGRVSTGFAALDQLLGGGLPQGQVVSLLGRPTSGMTTLAYKIMAQAQSTTAFALYIDLESTFDPDYAARCGVSLERLFLARLETDHHTLDVARDLLDSQGVGVVVLDLSHSQAHLASVQRLTHTLRRSGGLVLLLHTVSAAHLNTHSLQQAASLHLLVERNTWLKREDDIRGYRSCITQLMSHPGSNRQVLIDIDFDDTVAGEPL